MARIKPSTTYSVVKWGEHGGDATRSSTGVFRIIRFKGAVFLHEGDKGWLIPMTSVGGLTVTGSPGIL